MTYTCKHCGEEVKALTICRCKAAQEEAMNDEITLNAATEELKPLVGRIIQQDQQIFGMKTQLEQLTAENADLKRQLAECWAIIAKIDIAAPLADETCLEPGITLSEAVRRQLEEQGQ